MAQYQGYYGQFKLSASMVDLNVHNHTSSGAANCSLNSGSSVLIRGYDGESGEHLCEWLQNTIRDQSNHTNAVCNFCPASRRVGLYMAEACNIYFADRQLGNVLGFSNQWLNASQSYTGDKQPRYCWFPTRGLAHHPVDLNTWWGQRSTSKLTRSKDGTVRTIQGNRLLDGMYAYRNLPRADVTIDAMDSSDEFRSFEAFFRDVVHAGQKIRVYPDRSATNSSGYEEGFMALEQSTEEAMSVGAFEDYATRSQPPWSSLWDVEFSMLRNV